MVPNRTHDKGPYHAIPSILRTGNFTRWKKIADGRHHRHEPDSWLQSQTVVAANTLDLLKMNQPLSEGDTHDGSTPFVKIIRHFKTFGPCGCFIRFPGCICSIWASIWYVMGANTNGVPYNVQTNMPLGKVQFSSVRLGSARRDAACTSGILKRGGAYWRITCFFKPKNVATCSLSMTNGRTRTWCCSWFPGIQHGS